MIQRNGHPVDYIYNKFGNLIIKEEKILQEGTIKTLIWRYRYNMDGELIGVQINCPGEEIIFYCLNKLYSVTL